MPVEVVQFCWKYNAERLKKLPELAGCEVCNFISEIVCFPGAVCLSSHSALYCELESHLAISSHETLYSHIAENITA